MAFPSTTKTFDQMGSDNCSHLCCPIDLKILMTRLEQTASADEKTSANPMGKCYKFLILYDLNSKYL